MRDRYGCIIRGDTTSRQIALVFTADAYGEGAPVIVETLHQHGIKGAFFLTGNYLRNPENREAIQRMVANGHYIGPHSDGHLLYCDWDNRDSLLVSKEVFIEDLESNYRELDKWGVAKADAHLFMPPYEWYNRQIVEWGAEQGIQLVNFTPGLRTAADYTFPEMGKRYINSMMLYEHLLRYESQQSNGLNGFLLLMHLGTGPRRKDKFYDWLPMLIAECKTRGYKFVRIDELVH